CLFSAVRSAPSSEPQSAGSGSFAGACAARTKSDSRRASTPVNPAAAERNWRRSSIGNLHLSDLARILVPFQLFEANFFLRREEAAGRFRQRVFGSPEASWNGTSGPAGVIQERPAMCGRNSGDFL